MNSRKLLLEDIARQIAAIVLPHPVRVAIDGIDAAGKTTLADDLAAVIATLGRPVIRASVDGFHNPASVRRRRGALSPEGYFFDSFDYPALVKTLLAPLGPAGSLQYQRAVFDFRTDSRIDASAERADPAAILLLDGVFLLRRELRGHFDFSIFVRADFSVAAGRGETRDAALFGSLEEARRRYRERYVPGQQLYLASETPERWASVVVNNNDPEHPRLSPDSGRDH